MVNCIVYCDAILGRLCSRRYSENRAPNGRFRYQGTRANRMGSCLRLASHPRCSICHTGPSDRPMWSGPAYGKTREHGMNIQAGASRIGAETLLCSTCHTAVKESGSNDNTAPHAAPRVAMPWSLAPVEAHWFGRSSLQICEQLRNPELNGGRSMLEIAQHLNHDLIRHWAWKPGGGREPAPYSLQEHVNDILVWGVAGLPCPSN